MKLKKRHKKPLQYCKMNDLKEELGFSYDSNKWKDFKAATSCRNPLITWYLQKDQVFTVCRVGRIWGLEIDEVWTWTPLTCACSIIKKMIKVLSYRQSKILNFRKHTDLSTFDYHFEKPYLGYFLADPLEFLSIL